MRKTYKHYNSKGFTLVEMVLVIAIIVILASSLIIGVGQYITTANNAKDEVDDASRQVVDRIDQSENRLQSLGF